MCCWLLCPASGSSTLADQRGNLASMHCLVGGTYHVCRLTLQVVFCSPRCVCCHHFGELLQITWNHLRPSLKHVWNLELLPLLCSLQRSVLLCHVECSVVCLLSWLPISQVLSLSTTNSSRRLLLAADSFPSRSGACLSLDVSLSLSLSLS